MKYYHHNQEDNTNGSGLLVGITLLGVVVVVLFGIILVLTLKLRRANRKPIIRRRVVVSHRSDLDSNSSGSTVCEMIDIENCCNGSICETVHR
jgi:hypothetical protein